MKKLIAIMIGFGIIAAVNVIYADDGEESLSDLVDSVEAGLAAHKNQSESESVESLDGDNVIITTTTTTTTVSITTQKNDTLDTDVDEEVEVEVEVVTPVTKTVTKTPTELNITGTRPLNVGNLVLAEFLGAIVPGSGLAHFTLGDTTGGRIVLACTGVSLLMYLSAEVGIETRMIDNPDVYGTLHYGSMILFGAGYLFDLIHAPIYYKKYNDSLNTVSYFKALDTQYTAYEWNKGSLNLNVVSMGISF